MHKEIKNLSNRLYLSTIGEDASELASRYGLGLELCEFCTAENMDAPNFADWDSLVRQRMKKADRFILHAPFSEIYPSAIDPRAMRLAHERLLQAAGLAMSYGIRRMVVHGGYLPTVYFPQWFRERSILFWQRFLEDIPADFQILVENVLEDRPERLLEVVSAVDDPRLGLCLDVGHVTANTNSSLADWLRCLDSRISHVHIHNNFGGEDRHLPLGEGSIDMEWLLAELLARAPEASLTLENILPAPSLAWLWARGYLGETV